MYTGFRLPPLQPDAAAAARQASPGRPRDCRHDGVATAEHHTRLAPPPCRNAPHGRRRGRRFRGHDPGGAGRVVAELALHVEAPRSWIFGVPTPGSDPARHEVIGIAVVYGGMVVLLSAWYWLVASPLPRPRALRRLWGVSSSGCRPSSSPRRCSVATSTPTGPRAARVPRYQSLHPRSVGGGGRTFYGLADPLWRHAHAPYGPVFFDIARVNAHLSRSVFATFEGYRLVALLGVVLMALSVPCLARSLGRDPVPAFALPRSIPSCCCRSSAPCTTTPSWWACSWRAWPWPDAAILCSVSRCAPLGALVKVPCFLGVVFIGWDWAGPGASARRRVRYVVGSVVIGVAVMAVISEVSGLGWNWLWNLSDPGKVNSWLDPATAVGLAISHAVQGLGGGLHTHTLVEAGRAVALAVAAVIVAVLVVRTERYGMARGSGLEPAGRGLPRAHRVALVRDVGPRLLGGGGRRVVPTRRPRALHGGLFRHGALPRARPRSGRRRGGGDPHRGGGGSCLLACRGCPGAPTRGCGRFRRA